MKVTFLNIGDFGGGAAKAAYRLFSGMKQLHQNGIEIQFLTLKKQSTDDAVYLISALQKKKNILKKIISRLQRAVKSRFQNRKLSQYLNRTQSYIPNLYFSELEEALPNMEFDLLHLHWVFGGFVNFKELQSVNKPIVWTIHDCLSFTGICYYTGDCEKYKTECGHCPVLKSSHEKDYSTESFWIKKKRYSNLDLHIVSPSHWLADKARKSLLLGNKPVYVIPNGIDSTFFKPVRKQEARKALGLDPGKRHILFGAISIEGEQRKGYHYLKKALQLLDGKIDSDVEFSVIGSDYTVDGNFSFKTNYLGFISDESTLVNIYSAAELMMFPSLEENLSNMIMEASACGTATVAFDIGGNGDMIKHQQNGYLSKEKDTEDFAKGVLWCLANNEANRLGNKSREIVMENFTIEKVSQMYQTLYQKIR